MAKECIISDGNVVNGHKLLQVFKGSNIESDDKNIEQINFRLRHDDARGVSLLSFNYYTFSKKNHESIPGLYVIPKVSPDSYLGICDDKGEIIATLKYDDSRGDLVFTSFSGEDLTKPAEASQFLNKVVSSLTTQEYSLVELKREGIKLSYEPEAWKKKLEGMEICKNDKGKYAVYKGDYQTSLQLREDWKKLKLQNEVEGVVELVKDEEKTTLLKLKQSPNSDQSFNVRLPLLKKGDALVICARQYYATNNPDLKCVISRGDDDKIRVNWLPSGKESATQQYSDFWKTLSDDIQVHYIAAEKAAAEYVMLPDKPDVITAGKIVPVKSEAPQAPAASTTTQTKADGSVNDAPKSQQASSEKPKNHELQAVVTSFINDMKGNYFSRDIAKISSLVTTVVNNNPRDKLPTTNSEMIGLLAEAGAIKITEHKNKTGGRGWGQFFCDLLETVKAFFTGESVGKLMGKGTITISKEVDMDKLNKLMTAKEEPSKGMVR